MVIFTCKVTTQPMFVEISTNISSTQVHALKSTAACCGFAWATNMHETNQGREDLAGRALHRSYSRPTGRELAARGRTGRPARSAHPNRTPNSTPMASCFTARVYGCMPPLQSRSTWQQPCCTARISPCGKAMTTPRARHPGSQSLAPSMLLTRLFRVHP